MNHALVPLPSRAYRRRAVSDVSPPHVRLSISRFRWHPVYSLVQVMMKLTDVLFKRKSDEPEKEFTYTEFLNLVDR